MLRVFILSIVWRVFFSLSQMQQDRALRERSKLVIPNNGMYGHLATHSLPSGCCWEFWGHGDVCSWRSSGRCVGGNLGWSAVFTPFAHLGQNIRNSSKVGMAVAWKMWMETSTLVTLICPRFFARFLTRSSKAPRIPYLADYMCSYGPNVLGESNLVKSNHIVIQWRARNGWVVERGA
jgi:hypothetical protein